MVQPDLDSIILQENTALPLNDPRRGISLKHIFNYFVKGKNTREILRDDPRIRPETIMLARAYLMADFPDLHDQIESIRDTIPPHYKIMLDECLSYRLAPGIAEYFGEVIHTHENGLTHKKDPEVWKTAVNDIYDSIITRDCRMKDERRDLTLIAIKQAADIIKQEKERGVERVCLSEMPLIIHIDHDGVGDINEVTPLLLQRFHSDIIERIETRTTPYISLSLKYGLREGTSYALLVQEQEQPGWQPLSRAESWENTWRKRILSQMENGHNLSQERLRKVEEMVRNAALLCAQKIAPSAPASVHESMSILPPCSTVPFERDRAAHGKARLPNRPRPSEIFPAFKWPKYAV